MQPAIKILYSDKFEGEWAYIPSNIPREPLLGTLIGLNRDLC